MNKAIDTIAFDRGSARTRDDNGYLRVSGNVLSRSDVNDYRGNEIPGFDSLGLDPRKMYALFRDPEEMRKAAPTFCGLPLLNRHIPVTINEPPKEAIVGTIGSDVTFDEPDLTGSILVYDAASIAGIENGEQRSLSMSYRYVPVLESGEYRGKPYKIRMTQIVGNHGAIVPEPRVPGSLVADALPTETRPLPGMKQGPTKRKEFTTMAKQLAPALSRKALFASGALSAYLTPKLAADHAIDLNPILKGVTAKNWAKKQPDILKSITDGAKGKLAQDADLDSIVDLLNAVGKSDTGVEPDPNDPADPVTGDADTDYFKDKLSPEDHAKLCAMVAGKGAPAAAEPPAKDTDPPGGENDNDENAAAAASAAAKKDDQEAPMMKPAMDAAIAKAKEETRKETIAHMNAIRTAEEAVRPFLGPVVVAMDSAADVYKLALDAAGVDLTDVPTGAYAAMVRMLPKPGSEQPKAPVVAMDHAAAAGFAKRFPNAARIRVA